MTTPITALARRWRLEVDVATADWQLCPAITSFKPVIADPNLEDDGSYDDGGWDSSTKTSQGWKLEATFNRKISADSTTFNAVHELLRAAALAFGEDNQVSVRWMDRDGAPEAYQGTALVQWEPQNDARTDLDQVKVTLTGVGALTEITNPLAP